ncbi:MULTISPECIES: hypothetical protein [Sediminibacillus]|uniref:hypothetical protein n=1 Tax=Sediminibacillus TaxID=482460 RepID=UPI001295EBFE|nr:hypothetical protein [Sediminibacillus terrae]
MLLTINDNSFELENKLSAVESIIKKIENEVSDSNQFFSHLIIDDEEIFDQFELRIEEDIASIQEVKVVLKSIKQFVNDCLTTKEDYLTGAIPELEILIDELYQGPTNETWKKLGQLLEGLQWLNQLIDTIDKGSHHPGNWDAYLRLHATLVAEFSSLEQAINTQDHILIADILQYEVLAVLNSLKTETTTTIDREGTRSNVN